MQLNAQFHLRSTSVQPSFFPQQLIKLITSFIKDRPQEVVMNGRHSYEIAKIISGVTQGTVLGPVLFILFIKDIKLCVKKLTSAFFADDNRIMKEISCVNDTAMLQHDLNDVIHWSLQNNMLLHEDKFDLITHRANPLSTLYELPHISELLSYFTSSGITLYPTDTVEDLGVITSSDLSWSPHIGSIVSRARSVASWVLSVFKTRARPTMLTLYKLLVRSHLEYCCPLWNPTKKG